ncbi:site-specific integrase [Anaeromusa acidaminophila]|uniref:site-specific integrase n=1 Tax=Anaeromusa acidaminophila TaxID=81464 RepID=UPI000372DCD6|nr:site-specific integrase [Anaeromusa acidaminophila]
MEYVEPIRDKKQLDNMKRYLKEKNKRDWLLFVLGINSGLRISDLLNLKVSDVKDKDRVTLREEKTGKAKDFPLSENCRKAVAEYLKNETLMADCPLFYSRKKDSQGNHKPISRQQAYDILTEAARAVGIKDAIGTHTLRKTFGYWAYKAGHDITRIQHLMNHSSPSVTLRYIGITKDELDKVYIDLNL